MILHLDIAELAGSPSVLIGPDIIEESVQGDTSPLTRAQ